MKYAYDVFMSHSSNDKVEVSTLRTLLGKEFKVWFSYEGIEGSDEWVAKITEGITNSAILLVFWTKNASESQWVRKEIIEAQKQHKPIIPMRFDDTPLDILLGDIQAIDFQDSYIDAIGKLGRKIKDFIGIPSPGLTETMPWEYESRPSPWNDFFEKNNYLRPEAEDFALNSYTKQLYSLGGDSEKPLTRFATLVPQLAEFSGLAP